MRRIKKSNLCAATLLLLIVFSCPCVFGQEENAAAETQAQPEAAAAPAESGEAQAAPAPEEAPAAPAAQAQPVAESKKLPPNFEITPSGLLIEHVKPKEKQLLRINPELGFGGIVGKYRELGGFAWWQFDGGLGFTIKDDWHLRANVRAFRMAHEHTYLPDPYFPAPLMGATKTYGAWFVQPSIYAYYCLGHYEKFHYFFPMDLFIGAKLGMDFFLKPDAMPISRKHTEINYGIAFLWRWYFNRRIGAAPYAELSTVDYMKNWFVSYGISAFWDFDIIPYHEPLAKESTSTEDSSDNEAEEAAPPETAPVPQTPATPETAPTEEAPAEEAPAAPVEQQQ